MKPSRYRHRADTSSKPLIALAKQLGLGYVAIDGVIDGAFFVGQVVQLVDFKSPQSGHALTPMQGKLLAAGAPIAFISTAAQLELLAANMRRRAEGRQS